MTWILGIDTSHHVAVGLARDGEPVASEVVADTRAHGEALTPLIQRLCASVGIAMTGIDAYAVGMGPGPFTGPAHHDEEEMTTLLAPIVQVCDAISGARPGARREIVEAYIKRLNDLEAIAMSYPGVTKTYAIQAGRELRVIVGADKMNDDESIKLSDEIATKIQNEMTYPGQVKITVIRETRSIAYAK